VGDIDLLCDDNAVRNQWPSARVVECNMSHDSVVRSVKVFVGSKRVYLTQPLSKLVVLVPSN